MKRFYLTISLLTCLSSAFSQTINRYGSTSANFLEIGVGSANTAMGDAGVTFAQGPSSVYWNPAALAFVNKKYSKFILFTQSLLKAMCDDLKCKLEFEPILPKSPITCIGLINKGATFFCECNAKFAINENKK